SGSKAGWSGGCGLVRTRGDGATARQPPTHLLKGPRDEGASHDRLMHLGPDVVASAVFHNAVSRPKISRLTVKNLVSPSATPRAATPRAAALSRPVGRVVQGALRLAPRGNAGRRASSCTADLREHSVAGPRPSAASSWPCAMTRLQRRSRGTLWPCAEHTSASPAARRYHFTTPQRPCQ
ncbi:hypothetical protein M885DRAFT_153636, partial [Pelagophyceae sp. CCMP2097]